MSHRKNVLIKCVYFSLAPPPLPPHTRHLPPHTRHLPYSNLTTLRFLLAFLQDPDGRSGQSIFPSQTHPREQIVAITFSFSSPPSKLSLTVLSLQQIPDLGDHCHNLPSLAPSPRKVLSVTLLLFARRSSQTTHSNTLFSI